MTRIPIDKYKINQSMGVSTYLGKERGFVSWASLVQLYGNNWQVFIFFIRDRDPMPKGFRSDTILRHFMFLPQSRFAEIVDQLRNEGPNTLTFMDSDPSQATLHSGLEAVGEGECCTIVEDETEDGDGDGGAAGTATSKGYGAFDPTAQGHNLTNAYLLALASYHVYGGSGADNGPEFNEWYAAKFNTWMMQGPGTGTPKFDFISDEYGSVGTGFQAEIMSNDQFICLAVRGSQMDTAHDWIYNVLGFSPAPSLELPGTLIHSGWLEIAQRVFPEIKARLLEHRGTSDKPVWLTGHSMGGALAAILALMLMEDKEVTVQGVYTFGAPPVGDIGYLQKASGLGVNIRTHRWENDADPAPNLNFAPLGPLVGTFHVGSYHHIGATGELEIDQSLPLAPPLLFQLGDHDMVNYGRLLRLGMSTTVRRTVPYLRRDD